jgi:hypothetical protein
MIVVVVFFALALLCLAISSVTLIATNGISSFSLRKILVDWVRVFQRGFQDINWDGDNFYEKSLYFAWVPIAFIALILVITLIGYLQNRF